MYFAVLSDKIGVKLSMEDSFGLWLIIDSLEGKMNYFLAVDIGASSGRHIVGWLENGQLMTREVYRFPNGVQESGGHLVWDIQALEQSVRDGIDKALDEFGTIESLSIDTWGVDYVLLNGEKVIGPCYAYRDSRTQDVIPLVHREVPFDTLYSHTGIQFQPFNTVYQLYADKAAGRLDEATDFLMIPCYLMFRLCGVKAHEYTNATTGGLVNAQTKEYDEELIQRLGLPARLFPKLMQPGTPLGTYKGIRVMLCATHDTGSAVEGIPMEQNAPYISSGTWSLLGVKTDAPLTDGESLKCNWSNEGGVGYNRYQKNIMGMWLVNRLREELCPGKPFGEIVAEAEEDPFNEVIDAEHASLMAPESMKNAFDALLKHKPSAPAGYFRCAYLSLAACYQKALAELENNTHTHYDCLYIVGGGAKNAFLNDLTARATGKTVIALPIEATALGNLRIQAETR